MATAKELLKQALQLNKAKKWKEVVALLDDDTVELLNNSDLYTERAIAFSWLNYFKKSLVDANKAIAINADNAKAYNCRASVWMDKKDYGRAIEDYSQAIKSDKQYAIAYNNRGNTWSMMMEYDKAVLDYEKAIEIDPKYGTAYNGRATVWWNLKQYDKANKDYTRCIELRPDYVLAYYNRGETWFKLKEYEKALQDFYKVLELKDADYDTLMWIDRAKSRLGKNVTTSNNSEDKPFYLFVSVLNNYEDIPGEERSAILEKADEVMLNIVDEIRKHTAMNVTEDVVHYTKLKVADIIVGNDDSRLRYYNVVYMNDPEEGKVLLECLNDKQISDAFTTGQQEEDSNIYLGSFLPVVHSDELVLWRTYGKDENKNEAEGCSIVIDASFFDQEWKLLNPSIQTGRDDEGRTLQPLYRVMYYNKMNDSFEGDHGSTLKKEMKEFKKALKELLALKDKDLKDSNKNKAIDKIVFHIISELRYFVKSSSYSFERELRVIQFASSFSDEVKVDDNGGKWLPKRLYTESNRQIQKYVKKITLGPKVPHPEQWIYLEAMMKKKGYQITLQKSDVKFQ